ncbi:sortase [Candidatus Peregrinibacteria bacterium]|mgnify:CR=1 FL=1|jgi:LPXTG-site transpeptidase (sortase) family protein|nr:sortase [Candidatus Peregrinibacteria bacterium]MBT4631389.1 sortase [Candidatus Peregrinibacteria bacterium]
MDPLKDLTSHLAFKADKKILELEDEEYLRMDIPPHERLSTAILGLRVPSPFASLRTFVFTSLAIFTLLFSITNANSYSKIFMASIQDWSAEEEILVAETTHKEVDLLENSETIVKENDGIFPLGIQPTPFENRLEIPAINVNSRIVEPEFGLDSLIGQDWNALEDQIRSSLLNGLVHYPGTALPGDKGNVFITGHSSNVFWEKSDYNTVFALLPKIEEGDDIFVSYDQVDYHYRVISKKEVTPKEVGILEQGDDKIMTLMTCTPVGTVLRRLVVTAELIED